ncbi:MULTISPECIES: hypothetical protein [Asaia]|nr:MULTISPECIES: hypothetical protein [Asaia]
MDKPLSRDHVTIEALDSVWNHLDITPCNDDERVATGHARLTT